MSKLRRFLLGSFLGWSSLFAEKISDCMAYTFPYQTLECDWGVFLDGEFLYWYARETNLPFAAKFLVRPDNPEDPDDPFGTAFLAKIANLGTDWEPGLRIGLGWKPNCDGWDYFVYWTYFKNDRSDSENAPFSGFFPILGECGLYNPWWNGSNAFNQPAVFTSVKAKWKLIFNQIDAELGRKFWLSPCFVMRFYGGLRGAWTKTEFDVDANYDQDEGDTIRTITSSNDFENENWGVGLLAGFQPTFYFTQCFALYGNLSAGLLWGEFCGETNESYFRAEEGGVNFIDLNQSNDYKNSLYQMNFVFDLALGLRWEETWCCCRYLTTLDAGWEHHIWLNHGYRIQATNFLSQGNPSVHYSPSFNNIVSDLNYGGLVLRLRFDF